LEGQNLHARVNALESRFFTATPPIDAAVGSLWVNGPFTLVKTQQVDNNTARWRAQQTFSLSLALRDRLNIGQNIWQIRELPANILGGLVLHAGHPISFDISLDSNDTGATFAAVWYRVPPGATADAMGNPSAGVLLWSFDPAQQPGSSQQYHIPSISLGQSMYPGERLWIKLGAAYRNAITMQVQVVAHLALEFQQTG